MIEEIKQLSPRASVVDDHVPERAAAVVSRAIVARWERAGVRGWTLDESAFPVPAPSTLQHLVKQAAQTSPSGKALFSCVRCGSIRNLSPLPPSGACKGFGPAIAAGDIMAVLLEGGRYDVDSNGLPKPAKRA